MAESALLGGQGEVGIRKPPQCSLTQGLADAISDHQSANQGSAAYRSPKRDAKMGASVKSQAATDERPESHGLRKL